MLCEAMDLVISPRNGSCWYFECRPFPGILGRIAVSGTIFGMPFVHLAVFILLKVWRSDTGWGWMRDMRPVSPFRVVLAHKEEEGLARASRGAVRGVESP